MMTEPAPEEPLMKAASVPHPATDADILRLSEANPGWRIERTATGDVSLAPPAGAATSHRNVKLTVLVHQWAQRHGFVAFDSNGGFKLSDSSIVAPDAALVPAAAWHALTDDEREGFNPVVPAVAIELVSRSDSPGATREKLLRLRGLGVAHVVMIDPYRHQVWTDGTPPAGFDLDFSAIAG